jgi:hypothetical protein
LGHLNFPYRRKSEKNVVPLEKISRVDLNLIKKFNFYIKKVDLETFVKRETIFEVKKTIKENFPQNENFFIENIQNFSFSYSNLIIENSSQIFIEPSKIFQSKTSINSGFTRDSFIFASKLVETNNKVISLLSRCDFNFLKNLSIFEFMNKLKMNVTDE